MNSITLGLTYSWISNEQVLVYDVSSISTRVMMEWSNHVIEMLLMWPEGKRVQILYNLSQPKISIPYLIITNRDIFNIGITEFGRTRLQQILLARGNLFGRLAVLVPSTASGILLKKHSKVSNPAIESHLFSNYLEAVEWVTDVDSVDKNFGQTVKADENTIQQVKKQSGINSYRRAGKKLGLVYHHDAIIEIPFNHPLVIGRLNFQFNFFGDDVFFISRFHAQIDIIDGNLYIMDLTSTNGTFVNSKRIASRTWIKIEVGDEICFAFTVLRLDYINP